MTLKEAATIVGTTPDIRTERVIAERADRGWLVMWPDGRVEWFPARAPILRAIRSRIGDADVMVTEVEWR